MKGGITISNDMLITLNDLNKKKNKFTSLRDKKSEVKKAYDRLMKEERKQKRELLETKFAAIGQAIKHTGFPLTKKVILLGAILLAKDALESTDRADVIDSYIERYQMYLKDLPEKQKTFLEEGFPDDESIPKPSTGIESSNNLKESESNISEELIDSLNEGDANAPES
ncbi:hypothetical protein [Veillonella sp.]|uniref:hypothetical protein n=1 Tax=Veillonella sp. TaxID=1926307 RepID=UPI0025D70F77|nr:hypothetical protein [Veillonella sp.]